MLLGNMNATSDTDTYTYDIKRCSHKYRHMLDGIHLSIGNSHTVADVHLAYIINIGPSNFIKKPKPFHHQIDKVPHFPRIGTKNIFLSICNLSLSLCLSLSQKKSSKKKQYYPMGLRSRV